MSVVDLARGGVPHPASRVSAPAQDRLAELLLYLPIVGVTFFAKFGMSFGTRSISVALLFIWAALAAGLLLGRMQINGGNFVFYSAMVAVLAAEQVFGGNYFSGKSVALLVAIHFPYVVSLGNGLARQDSLLRFYANVALILALCGIAQFAGQFVTGYEMLFPIDQLPDGLLLGGYHNLIPLGSSGLYKSNGIFLTEPSELSQNLAIAIIIEFLFVRRFLQRLLRLFILAAGMAVSFSGTGLVLLACVAPLIIIIQRRLDLFLLLLVLGALGVGVALIAADALHLEVFVERAGELRQGGSETSGFARYVAGFYLFDQYLWQDLGRTLFGMGAGAWEGYSRRAIYSAAGVTWVKIPFEYGLIGAAVYFAFIGNCIFRSRQSIFLRWGMMVYLLLNEALVPFAHGLILPALVWPSDEKRDRDEGA
jgi:hypothetical protein